MKDLVDILPDYDTKVGNLNAKVLAARDAESAGYAHYMAKMLEASHAQREENRKLAEIRKIRHGIDPNAQQPSTQAILARPKERDFEHWCRPLVDCQVRDKDGNVDIGERKVTAQEVIIEEKRRRAPKNEVGQSTKDGSGQELREAAVNAFMCSPPAELTEEDKKRLAKPKPYEEPIALAQDTSKEEKRNGWDFRAWSTRWSNFLYKLRNHNDRA
jgi:hypothetical protein